MHYWQVASGSSGRDYSAEFIRFGMAFVGGPHCYHNITGLTSCPDCGTLFFDGPGFLGPIALSSISCRD
jgi:hypothetical protein